VTLENLDSIFAFVVIISGVSLLVTTLTQMVSALFGLRGSNLEWGVQTVAKQSRSKSCMPEKSAKLYSITR
jgi:hypothetical protein